MAPCNCCTTGDATRPGPPPAATPVRPRPWSTPSRCGPQTPCPGPAGTGITPRRTAAAKRHIAVDSTGLVLVVVIIAASVHDRDAARPLLWNLSRCCTRVRLAWADAGYAGKLATWAASLKIQLEIVRKRDAYAFEVLPRRWVVERTLCLDHRSPRLRPQVRTVALKPRGHGPVGHGHPDNPAPCHPEAITTKSSTHSGLLTN